MRRRAREAAKLKEQTYMDQLSEEQPEEEPIEVPSAESFDEAEGSFLNHLSVEELRDKHYERFGTKGYGLSKDELVEKLGN